MIRQNQRDGTLAERLRYFDADDVVGKDVLDLGCGYGALSFQLASFNPKSVTGVDLDRHVLAKAEEQRKRGDGQNRDRIRFIEARAWTVPLPAESIDTIVAFETLEQVMELRALLVDCRRVLRPSGKMLIWLSAFRGRRELTIEQIRLVVAELGLEMPRFERQGFGGQTLRRVLGWTLARLPIAGEYLTSCVVAELLKPRPAAEIRHLQVAQPATPVLQRRAI